MSSIYKGASSLAMYEIHTKGNFCKSKNINI